MLQIEGLNASSKTTLSIIDASGKTLQLLNTTGPSYTFNVQQIPSGNYYLKVETCGKVTMLKFVKE